MTWRAFVGAWGDEHRFRWVDEDGLTWAQARSEVRAHAEPFRTDECSDCREQGIEVLAELDALTEGQEWLGELDGEDMLLIPDSGPSTAAAELEGRWANSRRVMHELNAVQSSPFPLSPS